MKLMTVMLRRFDGKMVVANGMDEPCGPDEVACEPDVRHDTAAAHALRKAMDVIMPEVEIHEITGLADELMREWGWENIT